MRKKRGKLREERPPQNRNGFYLEIWFELYTYAHTWLSFSILFFLSSLSFSCSSFVLSHYLASIHVFIIFQEKKEDKRKKGKQTDSSLSISYQSWQNSYRRISSFHFPTIIVLLSSFSAVLDSLSSWNILVPDRLPSSFIKKWSQEYLSPRYLSLFSFSFSFVHSSL